MRADCRQGKRRNDLATAVPFERVGISVGIAEEVAR